MNESETNWYNEKTDDWTGPHVPSYVHQHILGGRCTMSMKIKRFAVLQPAPAPSHEPGGWPKCMSSDVIILDLIEYNQSTIAD